VSEGQPSALNVLVLHGPNLNLLGTREPHIYGSMTLDHINQRLTDYAGKFGATVRCVQSNHEGVLIDAIHDARGWAQGLIINPGGYTHTSVALRDAISAFGIASIEVHLSNTAAREEFRHKSLIGPVCLGTIMGLGWIGYQLALEALITRHSEQQNRL
jgi:3-dehydroquinate dehydratase II